MLRLVTLAAREKTQFATEFNDSDTYGSRFLETTDLTDLTRDESKRCRWRQWGPTVLD